MRHVTNEPPGHRPYETKQQTLPIVTGGRGLNPPRGRPEENAGFPSALDIGSAIIYDTNHRSLVARLATQRH